MNVLCPECPPRARQTAALPRLIASRVEALRQERLITFATQPLIDGHAPRATPLEERVDDLLDMLDTLRRLEQLAARAANGDGITVVADQRLIAENEETYYMLLERCRAEQTRGAMLHEAVVSTRRFA